MALPSGGTHSTRFRTALISGAGVRFAQKRKAGGRDGARAPRRAFGLVGRLRRQNLWVNAEALTTEIALFSAKNALKVRADMR